MEEARSHRVDSKRKWSESDRHSTATYREREVLRSRYDDRNRDRDRDRDRRYRSRSPRDSRHGRERWRDNREQRDPISRERRRDDRDERAGRTREGDRSADYREQRGSPSSGRHNIDKLEKDGTDHARIRSPRSEKFSDTHNNRTEIASVTTRIPTPPVSFKVVPTQEIDHMNVDGGDRKSKYILTRDKVTEDQEEEEVLVVEDDLAAMREIMGFADFGTTHQKKVIGNDISAVRKEKKTEYRQYMNRVGGFNRPLSPSHSSR